VTGILVLFHCESNPGYASASHEITFFKMAMRIVGSADNIHFGYRTLENGLSPTLPKELTHIIEFDSKITDHHYLSKIEDYVRSNNIQIIYGFDQPVKRKAYEYLRRAGVKYFVSYWGAPMSSLNTGIKLLARKLQVRLSRHRPDHFIFQSEGMQLTATHGCGIPKNRTSIVRTGIDTEKYAPDDTFQFYAHDNFNIPRNRSIVFFSGHMEERKGVAVIVRTAMQLINQQKRDDVHFLLLGNKHGEEQRFVDMFKGSEAENYITFGGYRTDLPNILKSCSVGFIASTGWDSFPMSSVEMAATELPLLVSDLEGLREAISAETGFLYTSGDHLAAAEKLSELLDNPEQRKTMGAAGRKRAIERFSVESQISGIESVVRRIAAPIL